jgi:hypothetical protein
MILFLLVFSVEYYRSHSDVSRVEILRLSNIDTYVPKQLGSKVCGMV